MLDKRFIVPVAAAVEVATGLWILVTPQLFIELFLGVATAVPALRICGLALLGLGLACWQEKQILAGRQAAAPIRGLLTYNALLTSYLLYLRILGGYRGILLVPAIVLHIVLTVLLIRQYFGAETRMP